MTTACSKKQAAMRQETGRDMSTDTTGIPSKTTDFAYALIRSGYPADHYCDEA